MNHARNSALYVGRVRHRRVRPKPHDLGYRVWHVLVDVDELADLDRDVRGFGHNRRSLVEFRDADHFGEGPGSVREKLGDLLAARGVDLPDGRVTVLTYPRVLGFVFNPVSFWFCHDRSGDLALVVAEVNNTFGDSWSYVLDELEPIAGGGVTARATKVLHVSPFLPVDDHEYRFTIRPPVAVEGSRQAVHMDVLDVEGRILDATLVETRRALTSSSLLRVFLSHPLVTLHTVVGIHWQAAKIFLRRKARFHRRPDPPSVSTVVH